MIDRLVEEELQTLRREFPIIAIMGPRQSGKTTLARKAFPDFDYASLEDVDHREFAANDPRGFLARYGRNTIFDEIQRVPELFSYLQTHVDGMKKNGKIVITGSSNFLLMERISQSLAGRIGITKLLPFCAAEMESLETDLGTILFKGGYPRIHDQNIRPEVFYKNYIATYIEKDIRQIKEISKLSAFTKFMRILAGRTGQELNASAIGDECGVTHNTVAEWISLLEASFLVCRIKPYHRNYNKRLVKNPKIYFTDTGLVCGLLGIRSAAELEYHFLRGSIFETFVVSELLKHNFSTGERFDIYFWRDNHKKEVDLVIDSGSSQIAVEIKSGETIHESSFDGLRYWMSLAEKKPEEMFLVYGGKESGIRNGMNVVGWNAILGEVAQRIR
jgi:predicted AAA+ superfamily ATPase